mgnify:CR=1 FL=1
MKNLLLVIIVFLSLVSCGKKSDPLKKVKGSKVCPGSSLSHDETAYFDWRTSNS